MANPNDYNRHLIAEYRATGGKITGRHAGRPILLLTTTGAKSGLSRTTPLMYVRDGDRVAVIASKGGAPTHPDWYHNLMAQPQVRVELGTEAFDATARVTEGAERERFWSTMIADWPFFADYQAGVTRQIPVVALDRRE